MAMAASFKISTVSIMLAVIVCASCVSARPGLFSESRYSDVAEKDNILNPVVTKSRILVTSYSTIDIQEYNRGRTLVMKNIFGFNKLTDLNAMLQLTADSNGTVNLPARKIRASEVTWGYQKDYLVVKLANDTHLNNEYVFVQVTNSSVVYRSVSPIYLYHDSSYNSSLAVSLVLAIIFMICSCCCWCAGVKQFYHLIRIAQLLHMINMISSRPHPSGSFALLDNFRHNFFNIVPNPVKIDEMTGNECQPSIEFYGQGWSCHAYNSLRNYVLGFIIYLVLFAFFMVNKFQDREFFARIKKTMAIEIFMLAIMPDVFLAIYVNAVAGLTNSVLSIGFLFSLILILWYGYIFTSYLGHYFEHNRLKTANFLKFFIFSRSDLTDRDTKLGIKVLAVTFDNVKILIVVMMIGLFYNAPKTQMVLIFLAFFMNALFLLLVRPYLNIMQNILFALSDLCFGILVSLLYGNHDRFTSSVIDTKEIAVDGGMSAMVIIIFIVNLVIYVIPILKGTDFNTVVHTRSTEPNKDDNEIGLTKKSSIINRKIEEKSDNFAHIETKNNLVMEHVDKPNNHKNSDIAGASKSISKIMSENELPKNQEELVAIKSRDNGNSEIQARKSVIKGYRPELEPSRPSEDHLLRESREIDRISNDNSHDHELKQGLGPKSGHYVQPKKNNLIMANQDRTEVSKMHSTDGKQIDKINANKDGPLPPIKSNELPPVNPGKVQVRRNFKPSDREQKDFDGM